MNRRATHSLGRSRRSTGGYLIVLFVVILAFVGVVSSMQVLILTSVATTSRAYDSFRQGATEAKRLEHAVAEAVLDVRQVGVAPAGSLSEAVRTRVRSLAVEGAAPDAVVVPDTLAAMSMFPNPAAPADPLTVVSSDLGGLLTPELSALVGARAAVYPAATFEFTSTRTVFEVTRTYRTRVTATLIASPLTRFPIAAYELPSEIGSVAPAASSAPPSDLPAGLVPSRDRAFIADLQAQPTVLPYHYRRRASIAAAYQFIFSQAFHSRVAEYVGVTHYHDLDAASGTAVLAGMTKSGTGATWDLGLAGSGTYNTITSTRDAAVLFSSTGGKRLRLSDSVGANGASALFLLVLGPTNVDAGPLHLELSTIARPVVIVGCNVRVSSAAGTAVNGALFLDPASSVTVSAPLVVGHFSYWAGTTRVPENAAVASTMPISAELLAPRVVYVATSATRL